MKKKPTNLSASVLASLENAADVDEPDMTFG